MGSREHPVSNIRVQELREAAGMSKAKLGRLAGISERTVRNIETGVYQPSFATAQALARALDVPLQSLVEDSST